MQLYRVGDISDPKAYLNSIGVESGGIAIMSKKMDLIFVMIRSLKAPAANILKQDALSIGAELAVPGGVILCDKPHYDCLLIGTRKHLEVLSRKELAQPFGLKDVAQSLKRLLRSTHFPTKIMGVINLNQDSFFSGSRFLPDEAVAASHKMISDGADIIDVGAVSSRPGAKAVCEEEELQRIQPFCDIVKSQKLYQKAIFSIDSYSPKVVEYALQSGFQLVNDITGASNPAIIKLAAAYQAQLCIMHMQGSPQTMQQDPQYDDVTAEVSRFFEARIETCETLGVKRENIILDVGIGFGKTLQHNLTLLKNMRHFTTFGCELLIGASRKSMIDHIIPTPTEARLPGTLAIHLKALENGANIIRCHDVGEHKQAISVWEAIAK